MFGRSALHLAAFVGLATVVALGVPEPVSAQAGITIRGVLVDDDSREPVSDARIVLMNRRGKEVQETLTGPMGHFTFEVRMGEYSIAAERIGYAWTKSQNFYTETTDTLDVEFRIDREVIVMDPLVVNVGAPTGQEIFEKRLEAGTQGVLFTPEMVDSLRPERHIGEIFRHADAVRVRWDWGLYEDDRTGPIPRIDTFRGAYQCMHWVVDGAPVEPPMFSHRGFPGRWTSASHWTVSRLANVRPEDLVAMEVYRAWNEVPEDYLQDMRIPNRWSLQTLIDINRKRCGIAYLWTEAGWS